MRVVLSKKKAWHAQFLGKEPRIVCAATPARLYFAIPCEVGWYRQ